MEEAVSKKIITKIDANPLLSKQKAENSIQRVAAYCRVSTDKEDQIHSYNAQVEYYTDIIAKNPKWRFVEIYADEGITGTDADKREDFKRMIRDCEKGKIDFILTKSVARFARNTVDSLKYVRQLKSKGIGVFFEEQCLDTLKSESELALGLYSVLAQAESENISANVRWGIQRRMQAGTFKFRYNLLGYRKGKDGNPEIVEDEAKYVVEIYEMYLEGYSIDQIKSYLEKEQVRTKTGKNGWSKNSIRNILTNERYTGDMLLQKTFVDNCISKKTKKNRGEMPKYLISNNHPAIISRETFKAVQYEMAKRLNRKRLSDNSITEQGKYSAKYPLSELLVCGDCGSPYRRWTWISGGKKKVVWRCISRIEHGKKVCPKSISVDDELLHKAIYKGVKDFIESNDSFNTKLLDSDGGKCDEDDLADYYALEQQLKELDSQMEEAAELEATTEGNKERIREEIIALSEKIVLLRERKKVLEDKILIRNNKNSCLAKNYDIYEKGELDVSTLNDVRLKKIIHYVRVMEDKSLILMFKNGISVSVAI